MGYKGLGRISGLASQEGLQDLSGVSNAMGLPTNWQEFPLFWSMECQQSLMKPLWILPRLSQLL